MKSVRIEAETLPEGWERAVLACWEQGEEFKTEYDKKGDPLSKDVTALIHVEDPFKEPRIHRAIPLGLDDLEIYRNEVVLSAHDYFMDDLNNDQRWEYTYAARMKEYDQIEKCITMLKKAPHTRRAKIEIWNTEKDLSPGNEHPPCLQYLWLRIENGKLNMNAHMRSSDAYKASYSNWFSFTELQKVIADRLSVGVGCFVFVADSYHVYGSYFEQFEGFLKTIQQRTFEERVWNTSFAIPHFIEGCNRLLNEEKSPDHIKKLIVQRKKFLEGL